MAVEEMVPGVLPAPVATRLRRPGWRDGRLVIGLLLVLASVALGARAVAAADRSVPVYAARGVLAPGTALTADRLEVVRVHLQGTGAQYLDARRPPPDGQVLVRTVGTGELVPASAVAAAAALRRRPVSIGLDGAAPAGLTAGSLVDVWASARQADTGTGTRYAAPQRLAQSAEVAAVADGGSGLTAGTGATVQVLLDPDELGPVLDAVANEARIALLPLPGTGNTS